MLSVFLDANVIYSITLTDVLLTLAEHDLFLPCGRLTYYKKHRKPPPEHCLTPHNKPSEKDR